MSYNNERYKKEIKKPEIRLTYAVLPVLSLIILLSLSLYLFSDNSSYGPNQIALMICAGIAAVIGHKHGCTWKEIEDGIKKGIHLSLSAIIILLFVGALIGTWILSGTIPTMISIGLKILSPEYFYAAACALCALVSLSIGSSWSTAGTVGIGLMGIASSFGMSPAITAGAVVSGAYFGDKISPLSETTNLAPAVLGVDLIEHIKHMMWTTIPSITIALLIFLFLGFSHHGTGNSENLENIVANLEQQFDLEWYLLIPLFILLYMSKKRFPAIPTIMIGAIMGAIFAAFFQPKAVELLAGSSEDSEHVLIILKGVWVALYDGYSSNTGNSEIDNLLSKGGMSSMLNTVWLILCAMTFGGVLERTGVLDRLVHESLRFVKGTCSLIVTTMTTCIGLNVITGEQYISILLPGQMFRVEFDRYKLEQKNLSRTLEDAGTITSPLIPWNSCGAYMSATLGVSTFVYLPFALFNLINLAVAIFYAYTGFKVKKTSDNDIGSKIQDVKSIISENK
ncbi:TPA: Na+/H+ antiporter NhaC [Vibrio parahaemolyticus]|nr:Na+/H+ antiporter NhaC [Vibrio parahaemolyticus]